MSEEWAEGRLAALNEVAVHAASLRHRNPVNGDGSNLMLDKVLEVLDLLAGSAIPSTLAAREWKRIENERDERYLQSLRHPL